MKNYLWERGIQISNGGIGEKKTKLFDLNKKAAEMRQIQQASSAKDCKNC